MVRLLTVELRRLVILFKPSRSSCSRSIALKRFNDTFGYQAGNALLDEVTMRPSRNKALRALARDKNTGYSGTLLKIL